MDDESHAAPTGSVDPRPNHRILIGGGAALGVIGLVVVLVLVLASPGPAANTKSKLVTATSRVPPLTRSSTPVPSTRPPTPEEALIARVPSSYRETCQALDDQDKRPDFQDVPAVSCAPNNTLSVFLYQLPNSTVMNSEYLSVTQANNLTSATCDPVANPTFRAVSVYATGSLQRGKALCYVGADQVVRIEWTDDALNIYGSIAAADTPANREQLYQFWVANGALLR